MTGRASGDVRRISIRVALAATGLVGAAYLVVALSVFAILTANLTGQVDRRLAQALERGPGRQPDAGPRLPDRERPDIGAFLLVWTDGVLSDAPRLESMPAGWLTLPEAYRGTRAPVSGTLDGVEFRLAGAPMGAGYVVVGQTTEEIGRAQSTLLLAELVLGPLLLVLVFVGSVAVGRRVALPIETARRRQMEFTADASHELRTPLSVVEAHTSLALSQDRSGEWYRSAFGRIDRESKRMRRLLDDLLWLARFDAAQGVPNAEPVDLAILAAQAADRFGAVAEARRLALTVGAPGPGLTVTAPPEWLDRLLGVLLDNACKYSPDGGTVDVGVAADSGRVTLTVDDSGPGIPEADRGNIFDRFHRATSTGTGAGLGLAIGDEIVRATGGRWKVGSSPAGGARLQVSWRAALQSSSPPSAQP